MDEYHFIGIGGVGMSALARILLQKGEIVRGSDLSLSYVTDGLKEQGAELFSYHSAAHIEPATTVIYSTDIKQNHPEFTAAVEKKRRILHRSELLAELMEKKQTLLVAGTHGKTTTSSLLAHLLVCAGSTPSYAIGGIVVSLNTNGAHGEGPYFVAEADESDGSFLNYPAFGAILTNIEPDHLDYWQDEQKLVEGFKKFALGVKSTDHFFWCAEDRCLVSLNFPGKSYGFSETANVYIYSWKQVGWNLFFNVEVEGRRYQDIEMPLIGRHNVLNAAAVFALGLSLGLSEATIRAAFLSFQGVKRRCERKGEKRGVTFLDDYGHHPTELAATLKALKEACGERRLVVAFQPHRYTRTRDLWADFPQSLKEADLLFLTDIYSARESPIEGISGETFFQHVAADVEGSVYFVKRSELASEMALYLKPHDVVVSLGAGDITHLSKEILEKEILRLKVALIAGGRSREHAVSLNSAMNVKNHLSAEFYETHLFVISKDGSWSYQEKHLPLPELVYQLQQCDLCIPFAHGVYGEDGMLQGFLQTLNLPYAGPDYRAGAVTMDKIWTKRIALSAGVEVAPFFELSVEEWKKDPEECLNAITHQLTFPLFIKPVHLGSTFGVSRALGRQELQRSIDLAFELDYKVVIEKEIEGKEMELALLGNGAVVVSEPGEIEKKEKIHTYEGKYGTHANKTLFNTLAPSVAKEGQELASKIYTLCGCSGFARIDFFLTSQNRWILNEVNPIPGCTPTSAFPELWKNSGLTFQQVMDRIVISALDRYRYEKRYLKPV